MKIAIFGYGSLANKNDLGRTLGRPVYELTPIVIYGWIRKWNAVISNNNTAPHFVFLDAQRSVPKHVAALNIMRIKDNRANVNGVLFDVSLEELNRMDMRETHYDRVDITDDILDTHTFDKIYTYTAKPEYVGVKHEKAIVPNSYISVVEQGFQSITSDWLNLFYETTFPPEHDIVAAEFISRN